MTKHNSTIFLFIFIMLFSNLLAAQTVFVPVRHWVYDYLDRMETKRLLPVVLGGTKPMTRNEIGGYLKALKKKRIKLSKTENEQLDFLLFEFQDAIGKKSKRRKYKSRLKKITQQNRIDPWLPDFVYPTGRHLLEIKHGPLRLNWDPIFYRSRMFADDDTLAAQERVNIDANGFLLWGTVGPWVGFYTDVRDTREWGTRAWPSGNTTVEGYGFVQGNGRQIYHDETIAYVLLQKKYARLQFGKDVNVWGPGKNGQLFLSDHATSYDQFKIQLALPRLKYTYLLAWLKHYTPDYFRGAPTTKFLAAHRLEFAPHRNIDIGLQSGVIYRERFEPAYLNPVMFFRSAEHYLGDTDNVVMGLDVEVKSIKNVKLYGELFLDDLTTGKLGTGFYGNKYAVTLGGLYAGMFGLKDLDLRVEYSRVRPFVYSHKDTVNSYSHFSTVLGHWMGANSALLTASLDYRLSRRWLLQATFEHYRFASNMPARNVGRGLFRPRNVLVDGEYFDTLDGVLHNTKTIGARARYEFVRNAFVTLDYEFSSSLIDVDAGNTKTVIRSQVVAGFALNY